MDMTDVPAQFGGRLRQARKNAGFTLKDVGLLFKDGPGEKALTKGTVGHWETNTTLPNIEQLMYLCRLYGVSADYLLFGRSATAHESLRLDPVSLELVASLDQSRLARLKKTMVDRVKELSEDQAMEASSKKSLDRPKAAHAAR